MKAWIRHQTPHWNTRTLHHSLSFNIGAALPVSRIPPWFAKQIQSSSFHFILAPHPSGTDNTNLWLLREAETPVDLSLCLDPGLFMETVYSRYQWSVRWESEQNDWLPISLLQHYLEQKVWLSNHWHKNRMRWWRLLIMNRRFSADFTLRALFWSLQASYDYTWLTGHQSRGC